MNGCVADVTQPFFCVLRTPAGHNVRQGKTYACYSGENIVK